MTPAEVTKAADLIHKLHIKADDIQIAREATSLYDMSVQDLLKDPAVLDYLRRIIVSKHEEQSNAIRAELLALGITVSQEEIATERARRKESRDRYRRDQMELMRKQGGITGGLTGATLSGGLSQGRQLGVSSASFADPRS